MVSVYVTFLYATTVFMVEILMAGWLEFEITLCTVMDTFDSSSAISAKMIKVQNWIKVRTEHNHATTCQIQLLINNLIDNVLKEARILT